MPLASNNWLYHYFFLIFELETQCRPRLDKKQVDQDMHCLTFIFILMPVYNGILG